MRPRYSLHAVIAAIALTAAGSASPCLAAAAHGAPDLTAKAAPVILSEQAGTLLDQRARELNAADLADAKSHDDDPVVLVASAPLSSSKGDMALFVQLQSARLCGSAGCTTSVYLRHHDKWRTVLDAVSGKISVLPSRHRGMHDLLIGTNDRWTWDGNAYKDTMPTAPIGDLRQSIEAHQRASATGKK